MKITKPMMNAERSSDSTKAGISVVSETSARVGRDFVSPTSLVISASSSARVCFEHELAQRLDAVVERLRLRSCRP